MKKILAAAGGLSALLILVLLIFWVGKPHWAKEQRLPSPTL